MKLVEAGPYGPSTETSSLSREEDESSLYNLVVQLPPVLKTILSLSGSMLSFELTVKGCHCNVEILGTLTNKLLATL